MTRSPFAERLQRLRRLRGLTQLDLSFAVGVPQSVVSAWETDKKEPCGQDIAALARELCIAQDVLLGRFLCAGCVTSQQEVARAPGTNVCRSCAQQDPLHPCDDGGWKEDIVRKNGALGE